jgi:flagellar protein FliS
MAYRKSALGGTSGFGLLIALYDTLAGDLRRAAEAERRNNLENRSRELNHALLVIAHLEDWLARGSGGDLAEQLRMVYSSLRAKIIEAQVKRSPEILEEQMARVLSIREIWQGIELRGSSTSANPPAWIPPQKYPSAAPSQIGRSSGSWSA